MKALDVQDRLEYARAGVAVLRALQITDRTMSYAEFARAIGLMAQSGKWQVWHRQQVSDVLNLIAATERQGPKDAATLEYDRVIVERTGKSGKGVTKESRIVRA